MTAPPARFVAPAAALALALLCVAPRSTAADALAPGAVLRLQDRGSGPVMDVAVSPDGATIAAGTARGDLQLWTVSDGKLANTLHAETAAVSVQFAAGGSRLVAAYSDGSVRVWDPRDGTMVKRLMVHPRGTRAVALSPDGKTLAGGGADGAIYLVETETGADRRAAHMRVASCDHPPEEAPQHRSPGRRPRRHIAECRRDHGCGPFPNRLTTSPSPPT